MTRSDSGQYMVEFALTLVIFLMFVFFVIDMGLMIYNHNLFYNGVIEGARQAKLGASNSQIEQVIDREVADNYFPTMLLIAHPESGVQITPSREIHRVDGTEVTVGLDTTFGVSFLGFFNIVAEYPISSSKIVNDGNDEDRDGCKDSLEGPGTSCDGYDQFASTEVQNHDNDDAANCGSSRCRDSYQWTGPDDDPDSDGILNDWDEVQIAYFETAPGGLPATPSCPTPAPGMLNPNGFYACPSIPVNPLPNYPICGSGYFIHRPNYPGGPAAGACLRQGDLWVPAANGRYHSPEIWHDGQEAVPKFFRRTLPVWHINNSADTTIIRTLQGNYDRDNDGWEDKYDDDFTDPTVQ